jgi:hypothetical protein
MLISNMVISGEVRSRESERRTSDLSLSIHAETMLIEDCKFSSVQAIGESEGPALFIVYAIMPTRVRPMAISATAETNED